MANKIEIRPFGEGAEIVRMVTTDRDVAIPEEIDGMKVVSLGDRFMMGSPNVDNRSVTVPATVVSFGRDAFSGVSGVRRIDYLGEFAVLSDSEIALDYDCTVSSFHDGRRFSFGFVSGYPVSFPGFDEAVISSGFRMTPEIAMARLSDPVMLTDGCRESYESYMRGRIVPMAERSVAANDPGSLMEAYSTGLLGRKELNDLLKLSVRSGKVSMTSAIMSLIRKSVSSQ